MTQTGLPTIYVVSGPNGAGKTTFSRRYLPDFVHCTEFLNADMIAAGLSPFSPETQDLRAAEMMLLRMDECIERGRSFGFEITLAGRSYVSRLNAAKARGFRVTTFFLWLADVKMALGRVAQRVRSGGHFVADQTVRARYEKGLRNFRDMYRQVSDIWQFYDASSLPPSLVAAGTASSFQVVDPTKFGSASPWISP